LKKDDALAGELLPAGLEMGDSQPVARFLQGDAEKFARHAD